MSYIDILVHGLANNAASIRRDTSVFSPIRRVQTSVQSFWTVLRKNTFERLRYQLHPSQVGFSSAPAGVMLDTAAMINQLRDKIYMQEVQLKAMPLANLTQMTDEERALLGAWYLSPAK